MGFSFAVWNVKRFNYSPQRVAVVAQLINDHNPDVFGILEFLAKDAARQLVRSGSFKKYDFAFTDSEQGIEILVGWKRSKFEQTLYTQRRELKVGNVRLRPGGLVSVLESSAGVFTNLLFLHTDSGTDASAYKNRHSMFGKVWSMKRALEKLPEQRGQARLIAMGDLNTMGQKNTHSPADEIKFLSAEAINNGMKVLEKTCATTWSGDGKKMSNLDHVIASTDVEFKPVQAGTLQAQVLVTGWVEKTGQQRLDFVHNVSDHCLLFAQTV